MTTDLLMPLKANTFRITRSFATADAATCVLFFSHFHLVAWRLMSFSYSVFASCAGRLRFYRATLCKRGNTVVLCLPACLFTARCNASALYAAVVICVFSSYAGIVSKRLNVGSHKLRRMRAQCQISLRNSNGVTQQGRQMQIGWVKIGDVWPICRYISRTVQHRHTVSIKVE